MKTKIIGLTLLVLLSCKSTKQTNSSNTDKKPVSKPSSGNVKKPVQGKMSEDSLDIKIGQMILVGISERTSLTSADALNKELTEGKIGGIALFEKNISKKKSHENLKTFIGELQKKSTIPLFISIDEEGG